jgi:hypothetical protein
MMVMVVMVVAVDDVAPHLSLLCISIESDHAKTEAVLIDLSRDDVSKVPGAHSTRVSRNESCINR